MNKVDWTKPLEAVHEGGRVAAVKSVIGPDGNGTRSDRGMYDGYCGVWNSDGSPRNHGIKDILKGWSIRNVQPAPATERPSDEVVERMVALVRQMHNDGICEDATIQSHYNTADDIAALLPTPIDPDLIEAREIAAKSSPALAHMYRKGTLDEGQYVKSILAGIKYGRTA